MRMFRKKPVCALGAAIATSFVLMPLTANGAIEEMFVTSQIVSESLQDVSVSVQVTDGEELLDSGVKGFEQLSVTLPAVNISKGGASDQVYIRGIGSGFNGGFEQAVGTYVDGIYVGRSRGTRGTFVDLDRIEVLKGSQSALFGNSSIAGALSVTSASPVIGEFEGHVAATLGEDGEENIEGAINIPLGETFAIRGAARSYQFDGYETNTVSGKDVGGNDDTFFRIGAKWEPTDTFSALLKYSEGESDQPAPFLKETVNCPSTFTDRMREGQATYNPSQPHRSASQTCFRQQTQIDNELNFRNQGDPEEGTHQEFSQTSLEINWDWDAVRLQSITGWVDNEQQELQDLDAGPLPIFNTNQYDTVDQFSQELRLISQTEGNLDWIVGAYYQDEEVEYYGSQMPYMIGAPAAGMGPLAGGHADAVAALGADAVFGSAQIHDQDMTTRSVFANTTWHLSDMNRLIFGLRWIDVEKDLVRDVDWLYFTDSTLDRSTAVLASTFGPDGSGFSPASDGSATFANGDVTDERHSASWDDLLPSIIWEHDVNDDLMVYASFSQGFKAGGFNFSGRDVETDPSFDEETVDNYEIGIKSFWLDGELRLNATAFVSKFEGVQQSALQPGTFSFIVGNASQSSTQGIEFDLQYAPTDNFELNAAVTFMDSQFDKFDGPCNAYQEGMLLNMLQIDPSDYYFADPDGAGPLQPILRGESDFGTFGRCTGRRIVDPTGSRNVVGTVNAGNEAREIMEASQDLKGHETTFAPTYSGRISATYTLELGNNFLFDIEPNVYFTDSYFIQQDFDPFTEQDAYAMWGLRLALSDLEGNWELSLIGKNLTDEETIFFANDLPAGGGSYVQSLNRPRSWAVQARYNF